MMEPLLGLAFACAVMLIVAWFVWILLGLAFSDADAMRDKHIDEKFNREISAEQYMLLTEWCRESDTVKDRAVLMREEHEFIRLVDFIILRSIYNVFEQEVNRAKFESTLNDV